MKTHGCEASRGQFRVVPAAALAILMTLGAAVRAAPSEGPRPERDQPKSAPEPATPNPMATHVYLNGGVGYGGAALDTFEAQASAERFSAGLFSTKSAGPSADLGVGLRLSILTLGLRASLIALQDPSAAETVGGTDLWSVDGEIGFHIPTGRLEPSFVLAGGYSRFGGLGQAIAGAGRGLDIDGANARVGLGLDWFATQHFSLGARATAEALFQSRRAVPLRDLTTMQEVATLSDAKKRALQADGTSLGTAYTIVIGPGLSF